MKIRDAVEAAHSVNDGATVVAPLDLGGNEQNQLLMFLKPETFLSNDRETPATVADLADRLINSFRLRMSGIIGVSGPTLGSLRAMDKHYGFINKMSRAASVSLDAKTLEGLRSRYATGPDGAVLGGHEFLERHQDWDAQKLDTLWATKKSDRIRSGLYAQLYDIPGTGPTILLNGFHPAQLEHFTAPGRKVILIVLNSDLPWSVLRRRMLGDTFPEKAVAGSFRRALYDTREKLGLPDVSIANNFAHLSAGPFEAAFELNNFLGSVCPDQFTIANSRLWKHGLRIGLTNDQLAGSLNNPPVEVAGTRLPLFDATEDCDSLTSLQLLASHGAG